MVAKRKKKHGAPRIRAKKSLGQHFLQDDSVIRRIITAIEELQPESLFEIGPGHGELTRHLLKFQCPLTAVELDETLAAHLRKHFQSQQGHEVTILTQDATKIDYRGLLSEHKKQVVVGNLPYNCAVNILKKLSAVRSRIQAMVVMLQLEVGEKITASVKSKQYSSLSVHFQRMFNTQILLRIPPTAFAPRPAVDSVLLLMKPDFRYTIVTPESEKCFDRLVTAAFMARRKKVLNSLSRAKHLMLDRSQWQQLLQQAAVNENQRAQDISVEAYIRMTEAYLDFMETHRGSDNEQNPY